MLVHGVSLDDRDANSWMVSYVRHDVGLKCCLHCEKVYCSWNNIAARVCLATKELEGLEIARFLRISQYNASASSDN